MATTDTHALARELLDAYSACKLIAVPPSARGTDFDLAAAYAVEAELVRLRRESGRRTLGLKVGYANKAVWRALKLETVAWAHMYDDTVYYARDGGASLSLAKLCPAKIEPEIIFKMKGPLQGEESDPAAILEAVEWLAVGFEIIHCVFADWKFQPADFVAAFGLHAALVVGEPVRVQSQNIPALIDQLANFKVKLLKDGELAAEGAGKNILRSPALCLGELASALARQNGAKPLAAGDLVSTGTLTESQLIAGGETWSVALEGMKLPVVKLRLAA